MLSFTPLKRLVVLAACLALATGQTDSVTDTAAALTAASVTATQTTGIELSAPTDSISQTTSAIISGSAAQTGADDDGDATASVTQATAAASSASGGSSSQSASNGNGGTAAVTQTSAAALAAATNSASQTTGAELSSVTSGVAASQTASATQAASGSAAAGGPPPGFGGPTTAVYTAPLPSATSYLDNSIFTLSDEFEVTDVPTTRDYHWDITAAAGAPDGSARQMYVVNNQFPGPLIEANTGDTINIHVTNWLEDGQSLHWHGITQNGSAFMDGVAGISQCPIPYGQTFTYTFTIQEQYGTFWWHSHYANTMADGLFGPLIVHSPNEPLRRGTDYDEDRVLMITDWLHDQSSVVVDALRNGTYRGSPAPPQGDSILVNGVGQTNCSASSAGTSCFTPNPAEIQVPSGKSIRFRVLNTAGYSFFRVSIDGHSIEVIEADSISVYGPTFHELPIGPGQRYSFLVRTDVGSSGDAYWLRVQAGIACIAGGVTRSGLAAFRYVDDGHASKQQPDSKAWDDLAADTSACVDLDQLESLTPRVAKDAWASPLKTQFMDSQRGAFVDINGNTFQGYGFDNISFQNQIYNPLLSVVESGAKIDAKWVRSVTFDGIGAGDILLNNLDPIEHPFHLHGNDFQILARGSGNITKETLSSVNYDGTNPLRRDTLWMPGLEWVLIRITTDNPGVWAFHCHIGWHLSEGKLATVVVQPDALHSYYQPAAWSALCDNTDSSAFGPSRRRHLTSDRSVGRNLLREVRGHLLQRRGPRDD